MANSEKINIHSAKLVTKVGVTFCAPRNPTREPICWDNPSTITQTKYDCSNLEGKKPAATNGKNGSVKKSHKNVNFQ